MRFVFIRICGSKDKGSSSYRDDSSIFQIYSVGIFQYFVHIERSGVAGCVSEYIPQLPLFVVFHSDGTMESINAGVAGFNRFVDVRPLEVTSELVVSHLKWDDLLECELVFYYNDTSTILVVGILVDMTLLMNARQL